MGHGSGSRITAGALVAALAVALACGDSSERPKPAASPGASTTPAKPAPPPEPEPEQEAEMSQEELALRGRGVFMANCIACHNRDPRSAGALGPAIAGSSLGLLEAKVLRGEYPPGYTPKRDSRAMIPLPYVEKELPALHAFLVAAAADSAAN